MKYLLCNTRQDNDGIEETVCVESDTYTDFAEAVKRYTLLCASCNHVVLADLEEKKIIRQYAHENSYTYNGGKSNAVCIF